MPWHELSLGGLGPLKIKKIDVNIKRTPKKHGHLDVTHLYIYTLLYLLSYNYNVFSKDNILREKMLEFDVNEAQLQLIIEVLYDDFMSLSIRVYGYFNSIKCHNGGDLSQASRSYFLKKTTHTNSKLFLLFTFD